MRDRIRMKKCFLFLYHPSCMLGRWVKVNSDPSLFLSFLLSVTFMSNNRISSLGVTSSLFSSFLILLHSKIGRPFCFSLSLSLSSLFLWRKGATVGSCYKHAVCMGNLPMRIFCRSWCMKMSGTTRTTSRHLVKKLLKN